MIRSRSLTLVLALALGAIALLAGCGARHDTVYRPTSFGEHNRCYYVNDISEVRLLQGDGRCQPSWTAYPMPLEWRQRYDDYYGSPDYYTKYVVVERRTVYTRAEEDFRRTNGPAISSQRTRATYADDKGKTYTGPDVVKSRSATATDAGGLGGGNRSGGLGGGDRKKASTTTKAKTSAGK